MGVAATNATYDLPEEQAVLDVLRSFGVRRARLFGSAARRELTPTSDIDLLVEMDGPVDYGAIFRLSEALERVAGRPFDVLTSIKAQFRPFVEPELVELAL
ncbi:MULTISPECIES: nucleotidyltransferase domain-containing protein [unclassified Dietzia]|jgi:predicted nucleotidyltransferase|uniref:nucleotidyltransferase family protein n=1 Tax=unclassified Dietzia TaxID=2617939 RepID=UPI0015FDC47E|nr:MULTISPECIES: nucleotidyltransferase domain-containing protein [unclassified Dietzia]MBB1040443.1 nucleotidyltransferase domain-containing protein [Dietzia sp. Cai40]MBB1043052.1 nucleotidyltransferase domain-containing protein [Dietzia sp. DQ11-44]MBB1058302.1 nucleotidyltransferase domain-containing protein [Dietzia sp. B19]MBC7270977.1 nucleotidyltransferase domain-containing protein [Streptomyces sp.]